MAQLGSTYMLSKAQMENVTIVHGFQWRQLGLVEKTGKAMGNGVLEFGADVTLGPE